MCAVDSRLYEPRTISSNMINALSYIQTNIAKYHISQKYFCTSCDTVEYILVGKSNDDSCLESHSPFCLQVIHLKRPALIHLHFFQLWSWAA